MDAVTDRRPDPMFDEAPDAGTYRGVFEWRKAEGSTCVRCGGVIEGRTFQVWLWGSPRGEWVHVRCVTPSEWLAGPPPTSGQGLAPVSWERRPRAGSGRADAVARAMVAPVSVEGEQEALWMP